MDAHTEGQSSVTLSAVIVRACVLCGGKREQDKDCESCGNTDPAIVHDLGVQAAEYSDPVQQLTWLLYGRRAAARRARQANKELEHGDDG